MATTRYQQGSVEVIQLDERLTIDDVDAARALISQSVQRKLPQLVVDIRRLLLIDSAGLELLLDITTECNMRGGRLRISGASPLMCDVLRVTGLDQQMTLDSDVIAAAGAFAR